MSGHRWFDHIERMENSRIAKIVIEGECMGSRPVGRTQKGGLIQ